MRGLFVGLLLVCGCGDQMGPAGGDDLSGSGPDAAMPDLTVPMNFGGVAMNSETVKLASGPYPEWGASAGFIPGSTAACAPPPVGSCRMNTCPAPPTSPPNAGKITATANGHTTYLYVNAMGGYDPITLSGQIWNGGETVTLSAPGGAVPAFSGTTTAPHPVTVTVPDLATQPAVDRSKDLSLSWTGAGAGDILEVTIFGYGSGAMPAPSVTCRLPAGPGTGAVPASALAGLPAGRGNLAAQTLNENDVFIGDWDIALEAISLAIQSDQTAYSGQIQLQ